MKKNILVLGITCLLVACSSDNKPDNGIYDMKTVQEYNARVHRRCHHAGEKRHGVDGERTHDHHRHGHHNFQVD